jgi:hypothetical protein
MVKIYKTKAGQNRFIQIFFSEINVSVGLGLILGSPLYFLDFDWITKITILGLIMVTTGAVLFHKVDKKPLYSFLIPFFQYLFSPKKYTSKSISTMSQFYYKIHDNLVYTNDQILKVFQIFPIDISILNEQDKQTFKNQLGVFLHAIGDNNSIQLKVVNRHATTSDYQGHFDELLTGARNSNASPRVIELQTEYIQNLKDKINYEAVPFKDYFLIIPQKMTKKPTSSLLETYHKELVRKANNLKEILSDSGVELIQLTGDELKQFYVNQFNKI